MISAREIIGIVALNFGLSPNELLAADRRGEVVQARRTAMYLARKLTAQSSVTLKHVFGCDHTTVLAGVEKMEAELRSAPHGPLAALCKSIEVSLAFRERLEALGGVDVLAVARRIAARPERGAIGASVMEIAALAATVIDLWAVAEAGEELAHLVTNEPENPAVAALARAIGEEMAALRGDNQENDDGQQD